MGIAWIPSSLARPDVNLVLRAEARLDVSNKDAFEAHDGTAIHNQIVGMVEALATF